MNEPTGKVINRRRVLTCSVIGAASAAGAMLVGSREAVAAPNGTRPTQLTGLSVTSVSATTMRVSGRWTTLSGQGISGYPVYVYSVGSANFTRWATLYPDSAGNFSGIMNKVPTGNSVQIEAEGNGAYSRPYPTFPRV